MAEKKLTELFSMLPDMAMQGLDPKDIMNVLTGQDTSDQMYDASMFGGPNGGLGVGTESQLSEFDKVMDMTGDTEVAKEMAKLKAADDNEQAILNQIVKEDKLGDSAVKNVLGMNPSLIRMEQEAEMTGNVNLSAATQAVMEESDYTDLEELTDSYAAAFGVNKEDIVSNIKEITKGQPDLSSDEAVMQAISSQASEEPLIPPPPQLLPTPPPMSAVAQPQPVRQDIGFEFLGGSPYMIDDSMFLDPQTGLPRGVPYNPNMETPAVSPGTNVADGAGTADGTGTADGGEEASVFRMWMQGKYEIGANWDAEDTSSLIGLFSISTEPDDLGGSYSIGFYYDPSSQQMFGYSPEWGEGNPWKSLGQFALDGNNLNINDSIFTLNQDKTSFTWPEGLGLQTIEWDMPEMPTSTTVEGVKDTVDDAWPIVSPDILRTFEGSPRALWKGIRTLQLGRRAEIPQWQSTIMQGFIPKYGSYLLGGDLETTFASHLKRTATEEIDPADVAENWRLAVEASRNLGRPIFEETGERKPLTASPKPTEDTVAPLSSPYSKKITFTDFFSSDTPERNKSNTLAMISSYLNINPSSYTGAAAYRQLGNMYDIHAVRESMRGADPGTFLSWVSDQMAPRQPIEQPSTGNVVNPDMMSPTDDDMLTAMAKTNSWG